MSYNTLPVSLGCQTVSVVVQAQASDKCRDTIQSCAGHGCVNDHGPTASVDRVKKDFNAIDMI